MRMRSTVKAPSLQRASRTLVVAPAIALSLSGCGSLISRSSSLLESTVAADLGFLVPVEGMEIDFGNRALSSAVTRSLGLKNLGRGAVSNLEFSLEGSGFSISSNGCENQTLDQEQSCSIDILLTVGASGAYESILTLSYSTGGVTESFEISLSAYGLSGLVDSQSVDTYSSIAALPTAVGASGSQVIVVLESTPSLLQADGVEWSPVVASSAGRVTPSLSSYGFGSVVSGSTGSYTVGWTNTGGLSASDLAVNITGTGQFTHTSTCGSTLAVGASCSSTVTFSPTSVTSQTGSLVLGYNTGFEAVTASVSLTGTGTAGGGSGAPVLVINEGPSYAFPDLAVGTPSLKTFLVSNVGTAAATSLAGEAFVTGGLFFNSTAGPFLARVEAAAVR